MTHTFFLIQDIETWHHIYVKADNSEVKRHVVDFETGLWLSLM